MKSSTQEPASIVLSASVNTAFGKRLQLWRTNRRITQSVLADRAGLSRVSIANLEGGRQNVSLHQIHVLARTLDVPMVDLVPTPAEIDQCTRNEASSSQTSNLSRADSIFLEETRALLTAQLRSSYADATHPTAD